ncbi:MAG: hypothetical protein ACRDI0_08735 [Actinomycetota bacterium]
MSGLDDRLDDEVRRLAGRVDGAKAFPVVARRKRRRRLVRRVNTAILATAIVAGSAAGALALARAFNLGSTSPADDPVVGPTVTPSPADAASACPAIEGQDLPPSYQPVGPVAEADITGGGRSVIVIRGDKERPPRCRYVLQATQDGGPVYRAFIGAVPWPPEPPSILLSAEIDGQPGAEVVVEFGGPGHPHRTGQVFTFEPGPSRLATGTLVQMRLQPPQPPEAEGLVPLSGEFAAGVDCTGPGTIVVTSGDLAQGGADDSHFDVTRTFYRAVDGTFVVTGTESHVVEVGTEAERWPELADDPFRSCP